jgi:small-conductance mechanosensitive channel
MKSNLTTGFLASLIPAGLIILILAVISLAAPLVESYILQFFPEQMARQMAGETFTSFLKIAKIFLWMGLVIIIVRLVNSLIFRASRRGAKEKQSSTLARNVFSITIYVVSFFIIFKSQYPGIDLAAVFTTSAILGVILGLALQDTLGNLFAGLSLQADQPFQVGDVIAIGTRGTGVVESVTWRGVKIRTFQNKLLIISNSSLGKEFIEVAPKDNLNARLVYFSTLYVDSPAKTIHVVREAIREAENVSQMLRPIVRIRNLGENGIEWEIKYWLENYARYNDTDALVRQLVWYAFQREGITFNFPTRTLHLERRKTLAETRSETTEIYARLSEIEIFEPLTDAETMKLADATMRRVFAPGETIIRMGDAGETMFVINRGSVKIQIPEGNEMRTLTTLGEGRFFGEMALLTGAPRTATVIAAEETEVFEIGHAPVKNLFDSNPYLVEALSKAVAERRAVLNANNETQNGRHNEEHHAGIFDGIKRFFRLN